MSNWTAQLESRLVDGEEILEIVDDLYLEFLSVIETNFIRDIRKNNGALALSNFRLFAVWQDGYVNDYWEWLSVISANAIYEIDRLSDKRKKPRRFIVLLANGTGLAGSTSNLDFEQERKLSAFLVRALMVLSKRQTDNSSPKTGDSSSQ